MARERTTFGSHTNTAHVWAQQTVTGYGKASDGRINFNGDTIYSYGSHFPIARFLTRKGKRCVLFTTRGYSSSTGKHKTIVSHALSGLNVPVFYLSNVHHTPSVADVAALQEAADEAVKSFARSTPWDIRRQLKSMQDNVDAHNAMLVFFGIRRRVKLPAVSDGVMAAVKARVAKKKARDDAKQEARRIANLKHDRRTLAEYRAGGNHNMRDQDWGIASTYSADDHAVHDAAYAVIIADKVAAWRAGKPVDFGYYEQPPTMLRVKGDVVQTSRGAEFPAEHAKRAFPVVARCREKGTTWQRNGHSVHLGHYQLDSIEADGTVHAGCHTVPWGEIEQAARELGLVV